MLAPDQIERLLVITAHPDDVDFGAAGTIATLTDAGVEVTYCLVTDGDAGGSDRTMSRAEMAMLRRREQAAAAAVVGVDRLIFLGRPDGRVVPDLSLREALSRVIREVRPTVVLTQSPEFHFDRIYASHPDHRATGEAALSAVYPDARNPFAFPALLTDGLEPWTVPEVWLMGAPANTSYVDITATLERKLEALRHHESQLGDPEAMERLVRAWVAGTAAAAGMAEGTAAEAFRLVPTA